MIREFIAFSYTFWYFWVISALLSVIFMFCNIGAEFINIFTSSMYGGKVFRRQDETHKLSVIMLCISLFMCVMALLSPVIKFIEPFW